MVTRRNKEGDGSDNGSGKGRRVSERVSSAVLAVEVNWEIPAVVELRQNRERSRVTESVRC